MFKFLLCVLVASSAFASGNYQRNSYSAPAGTTTTIYAVGPQVRDAKTIEKDILQWERPGVAIEGVSASGQKFVVKGTYTNKADFERFLLKLKVSDDGRVRSVTVKEQSATYGGSTSYTFEAEADNAW